MAQLAGFEAPSRLSVEESPLRKVRDLSSKHLSLTSALAEGILLDDSLGVGWIDSDSEGSVVAVCLGDTVSPIEASIDVADPIGLDVPEEVSATGDWECFSD